MEDTLLPVKKRKFWQRGLIALMWAVSLLALFYGVMDWHGHRAWMNYRRSYETRVGSLDLRSYEPGEIPASENFAATPFIQSWFNTRDTHFLFDRDAFARASQQLSELPKSPDGLYHGKTFWDLTAWREALDWVRDHTNRTEKTFDLYRFDPASRAQAAPSVLDGMKADADVLEELRAASARPGSRYPVVYTANNPWAVSIPHLMRVKQLVRRLEIRASAELALDQNEKAFADVKLMLDAADSIKTEPFLVSYLVRIACVNIALQPLWEGLGEHRWTAAQLQAWQDRFASYDWFADMQNPLNFECAGGVWAVDFLQQKGFGAFRAYAKNSGPTNYPMTGQSALNLIGDILPKGWYAEEKRHFCLAFEKEFRGAVDVPARRIYPRQVDANAAVVTAMEKQNMKDDPHAVNAGVLHAVIHHQFISALQLPALAKIPSKAAKAQTATDQAAMACALERFRQKNGQFPATLAALVPDFISRLPNDVMTGEPFKYRLTGDGKFILYSVGWNGVDDGGMPGKVWYDQKEGDWVW